jgi:hypothetical protein
VAGAEKAGDDLKVIGVPKATVPRKGARPTVLREANVRLKKMRHRRNPRRTRLSDGLRRNGSSAGSQVVADLIYSCSRTNPAGSNAS